MEDDDKSRRGKFRTLCFIVYFIFIEIIAMGCLGLAAFTMNYEPIQKLKIWNQFDADIPNLLPILVLIASILTIISPVFGLIGVFKNSQVIITVHFGAMMMTALFWLGIGAWCASLHKLIIGDISIIFERLKRDGLSITEDAQQFLMDLRENMPRISREHNFVCCESTTDGALYACAELCGEQYESLFRVVIFPILYTVLFGVGGMCLLALLCSCLVSCHLDDVNPAF